MQSVVVVNVDPLVQVNVAEGVIVDVVMVVLEALDVVEEGVVDFEVVVDDLEDVVVDDLTETVVVFVVGILDETEVVKDLEVLTIDVVEDLGVLTIEMVDVFEVAGLAGDHVHEVVLDGGAALAQENSKEAAITCKDSLSGNIVVDYLCAMKEEILQV